MTFLGFALEPKEEDEVVTGRQMCGADYSAMISLYPMLTPEEYNWTLCKILVVIILTLATPAHGGSLVYAINSDEQDIALENVSLMSIAFMHDCIYWLLVYHRSDVKDLFRSVGSGLYRYTTALSDTRTYFRTNRYEYLLKFNRYYTSAICLCYFTVLPGLKTLLSGKITTENDSGKYPFNKNLPVRIFLPYKTDTHFTYWPTFALEVTLSTFCGLIMSSASNMYLGFNVQIWNQLELLIQSIGRIGERASDLFATRTGIQAADNFNTKEFQDCLTWCLKENIKHHIKIIKYFRKVNRLFSSWLFFQLLVTGFITCVTLYRVVKVENAAGLIFVFDVTSRLLFLNFSLLHVTIYCMAGQKTSNVSHELHEAFYGCNWYNYGNKDFSMIVTVSLAVSNRPFVISGYGIIPADANTLVNIMRSTYSLLNFIHFLVG